MAHERTTGGNQERLKQADVLSSRALERPVRERTSFLDAECAGDRALRQEVETLIEESQLTQTLLTSGLDQAATDRGELSQSLEGRRLGKFEILSRIGAGGMGEVWLARDASLERHVALKLLRPQLTSNQEGLQLFMREAKAASALNHPNIITIHEFGQAGDLRYMATEFIEGVTLRSILLNRHLPLRETLDLIRQVAAALATAHQAGIVHRDIKPENIMVRPDGLVKVLDFGLAQMSPRMREMRWPMDAAAAGDGKLRGTVHYMSPEQAKGLPVDERSDIFSLGVVLYEMLAGRRPFGGDKMTAALREIVHAAPAPLLAANHEIPVELERVVLRALEKDPAARFATAREMGDALGAVALLLAQEPVRGATAPAARARIAWIGVAALVALAALVWGLNQWGWLNRDRLPPMKIMPLTADSGFQISPAFSPDGTQVAYSWNGDRSTNYQIYVKAVGGQIPRHLTSGSGSALDPAWSPDGNWIAYKAVRGDESGLALVSSSGSAGRRIARGQWIGQLSWTPDGKYVAVGRAHSEMNPQPRDGEMILVPVDGGVPRTVLQPEPGKWCLDPDFHPSGKTLSYIVCEGPLAAPRCQARTVSLNRDWSVAGASRAVTRIQRALSGLHWTADGKALLYSSGSAAANYLWRIDAGGGEASRLEVAGSLAFDPAVARRGNRAAYRQFVGNLDVWRMDARGASRPLIASSYLDDSGRYSPDGTRIVFSTQRGLESRELWLANADGSEQTPLTHGPGIHQGSPCWSPDGKWIAFDSQDGTTAVWQIWKIEAAGGVPRRVTSLPAGANVPFWSRDGRTIYFNSLHQGRKEIFRIPAAGGTPEQVTRAGGVVVQESPDGRISYYTKSRDDSPLYAMPTAGGAERQVLPLVSNRGFQVFDDGVYYQISSDGKTEVRFREFAGGNERVIGSVDSAMDIYLSVSPDRSWILFTYSPNTGSNLMLIENFR